MGTGKRLRRITSPTPSPVPESGLRMFPLSRKRVCWLGLGMLAAGGSVAQSSGFTPTLSASSSFSEVKGRSTAQQDSQFITQISPGFRWAGRAGRLQGTIDYTLNAKFYSKQDEADTRQNALAATLRGELVEDWFFVDGRASIAQEAVTPFGRPVTSSPAANDNATEVRQFSLSPYIRGRVFGTATYEARWTAARVRGARKEASNSDTDTASISLNNAAASKLGWGLAATRQRVDFGSGANSANDRINAQVSWAVDVDLRLGLTGGRESTDIVGGTSRSYDNWGWTLRWTPSPRTDLSVLSERRYFGNSHSLSLTHRMRRSSLIYNDTRGSSSGSGAFGIGRPVSLYSVYFDLFASQEPDPVLRDQLVRSFLSSIGQDPSALVSGGFLTSAVSLQRRQNLGLAIQGVRTNISLQAFRGYTRSLQTSGGAQQAQPVQQSGFLTSISYRLTPTSALSLSGSRQRTVSDGTQPESDNQSANLSWSSVLGPHVSTSIALRHTDFNGLSNSYRETAATASLNVRF